jgi:hypothetical protein
MDRLAEIRMLFADDTSSLFEDFFSELPNRLDSLHEAVHKRSNQDVVESAGHAGLSNPPTSTTSTRPVPRCCALK